MISIIISYLPYALITAFTPGPNNLISFYSVSQNGWKKGSSIILGIAIGFLFVMSLAALFCYELVKYVGAAYIAYLAIHILLRNLMIALIKMLPLLKDFCFNSQMLKPYYMVLLFTLLM